MRKTVHVGVFVSSQHVQLYYVTKYGNIQPREFVWSKLMYLAMFVLLFALNFSAYLVKL